MLWTFRLGVQVCVGSGGGGALHVWLSLLICKLKIGKYFCNFQEEISANVTFLVSSSGNKLHDKRHSNQWQQIYPRDLNLQQEFLKTPYSFGTVENRKKRKLSEKKKHEDEKDLKKEQKEKKNKKKTRSTLSKPGDVSRAVSQQGHRLQLPRVQVTIKKGLCTWPRFSSGRGTVKVAWILRPRVFSR